VNFDNARRRPPPLPERAKAGRLTAALERTWYRAWLIRGIAAELSPLAGIALIGLAAVGIVSLQLGAAGALVQLSRRL